MLADWPDAIAERAQVVSRSDPREMRMRFLYPAILAVGVLAGSPAPVAAPLTRPELATLREIDPRYPGGQPSEAALGLARRIGSEANLDGLRALIAMRDLRLLSEAIQAFNLGDARVLPEPTEALLIEFYADRDIGPRLLGILARGIDPGMGRYPKYRSRKLFDLLYADLTARPRDAYGTAIQIVATDLPDIEPELIAALPTLEPAAANEVVLLLGARRYAPAVTALRALQAGTPPARAVNDLFGNINHALLRIGTPEAAQAVLDRFAKLRTESDPATAREIATTLYLASRLPSDAQPDYAALRAALPAELDPAVQRDAVQLIAARKDPRGIPELIDAVGRGNDEALTVLLALGAPSDWNAGRVKLARVSDLPSQTPGQSARMKERLDRALADPSRFIRERDEAERVRAFGVARAQTDRRLQSALSLRASDPRRHAADVEIALKDAEGLLADNAGRAEAVSLRRDTAQAYRRLAAYTRFTLHDPNRAVALYERAIALSSALPQPENVGLVERIALADTVRFALKDSRRALRMYEQLQQQIATNPPSSNELEAAVSGLLGEWLRAEIAFLRDGRRYAGTPGRDTLGAFALFAYYGSSAFREDDATLMAIATALDAPVTRASARRALARQLESLSPSQARILGAFDFLPLLETPERVATFLRRNDPTGFLSAGALVASRAVPGNPPGRMPPGSQGMRTATWTASERALMRRAEAVTLGRMVVVDMRPDPKLGSPEATWKTFLAALRKGELDAVWKCTTPGVRNKLEPSLRAMTPSALKEMADAMVGFERSGEYGEFVEAVVVRANRRAAVVTFVREGKEWRIAEI